MLSMLELAANIALPANTFDPRGFWLGAVGIREDGVIVQSRNGAVNCSSMTDYQLIPGAHAEGRVLRKMGRGGVIFVARVAKKDRAFVMARPCPTCRVRITSAKVEKVYYTIDHNHYGIWFVNKDYDKIQEI